MSAEPGGKNSAKLYKRFKGSFGTLSDPNIIDSIKKLKLDFELTNFVETGTYNGETSFFFSGIFDQVFTCDVYDSPKRIPFILLQDEHTFKYPNL